MKRILLILLLPVSFMLFQSAQAELNDRETNSLKLQLFLNNNNIGPGYLDAHAGQFTMLAIRNYNLKLGRSETDFRYVQEAQAAITEPLITAIIPSTADQFINPELSSDKEKQAKLKFLPYRSYAEYAAERFHTSVSFLKQINGAKKINSLGPRSPLLVPNVEPFLIEKLKHGKMHKASEDLRNRYVIIDTDINQIFIFEREFLSTATTKATTPVESEEEMGGGHGDDKEAATTKNVSTKLSDEKIFTTLTFKDLVASFPITPGKPQFIRRGYWKIKNSVELPIWRYDKALLETGIRGEESLIIPGGPNNPVGVVWNGLTRKGIGIHGTSSPETIGRSQSAGCIRLANWDVVKLTQLICPGNKVWLR